MARRHATEVDYRAIQLRLLEHAENGPAVYGGRQYQRVASSPRFPIKYCTLLHRRNKCPNSEEQTQILLKEYINVKNYNVGIYMSKKETAKYKSFSAILCSL